MRASQRDELLRYYQSELTYLRKAGSEFAELYPRVARRLELGKDECADPNVERLLESFAFLTARLQHDIDSEFPEITTALLSVLYPQFTNPVPPMTIARFDVDAEQGKITEGDVIARHTPLVAYTSDGLPCQFRTCYPITLWPLEVTDAAFEDTGQFGFLDTNIKVESVLRLKLRCLVGTLDDLTLENLRFYLNGDPMMVNTLYEMLFSSVHKIAILPEDKSFPVYLSHKSIKQVGFGLDEEVLPFPRHAHPGYRLLQEYFAFPQKYLFFDLDNLDGHHKIVKDDDKNPKTTLDLLFMLDRKPKEKLAIDKETFVLGCTPIINLFPKTTEPIRLDHKSLDYRLIPDKRRETTTEIHSILSVSASSNADDVSRNFEPFYSYNHHMEGNEHKAFWHARRLASERKDVPGTEIFLSFLDLEFQPSDPPAQTVFAHTLCSNRGLASQLPAGALLQTEAKAKLRGISCLFKPTPPLTPPLGGQTLWHLISHLSLNYLSLSEGRDGLNALREILKLYSFSDWSPTEKQITGIRDMSCRKVVRHMGQDAWRGFHRGTEITLVFDEEMYVGSGPFVLGAVLSRFFGLYTSINSFTELIIMRKQPEEVWKKWPPMAGEKEVL